MLLLPACGTGTGLDPLDRDHDGWIEPWDCDDLDPQVNPDGVEVCDGRDNDCEGSVDGPDAIDAFLRYWDGDGDGAGDDLQATRLCEELDGFVAEGGDCDDDNPDIGPFSDERCDLIDNDCDGFIDESDAVDATTWWLDQDDDGFGGDDASTQACTQPPGYAELDTDCDDADPLVNPDAEEVCDPDDTDEDCDGLADGEDPDAGGLIPWYLDQDGDGYGIDGDAATSCDALDGRSERGGDCDDADDGVHPDALELCGNGLDDDCDGLIDGADDDATGDVTLYADDDGDGFGDPARPVGSGCDLAPGTSATPTDCDDTDPDIHPGAAETWYDGVDQDCDGDDQDADGDGFAAQVVGGQDCDDAEPTVNPDAIELCGNGVDDDCDGVADPCAAAAMVEGAAAGDRAGIAVAGLGDIDGDTLADWLVGGDHAGAGGAGAAWVLSGPLSGTASLADQLQLTGPEDGGHLGHAVAGPGDLDGDGLGDLLVAAPDADGGGGSGSGAVWLLSGPLSAGGDVDSLAWGLLVGEDADDRAGSAVAGAGDINGDGWLDLVVGASNADPASTRSGSVYLVHGPVSGTLDLWLADGKVAGESAGDEAGAALAGVGDVDGDGLDDVLVGAPQQRGGGDWPGAGYLLLGPGTALSDLGDAHAKLVGTAPADRAGAAVGRAGDVDGDGYFDLLVGAPERDLGGSGSGAAYLVLGPVSGERDLSASDLVVSGASPEDRAGVAVLGDVDLDGDGRVDLLVGADSDDAAFSNGGAVYILLAPATGSLDLDDSDLRLDASADDQALGHALATAPDADGPGADTVIIGAPHDGAAGEDAGGAWLLTGW